MTERAAQLHAIADAQVDSLVDMVSGLDEAGLRRPCPGREKLGDGTVGALAAHTAANYGRIGMFVAARGTEPGSHGEAGHQPFPSVADPDQLLDQLSAARGYLAQIAALTDRDLGEIPAKDSFRFCDGQRNLDQVLTGLLKHQEHQVAALRAAAA
jgi:hypothetical protein